MLSHMFCFIFTAFFISCSLSFSSESKSRQILPPQNSRCSGFCIYRTCFDTTAGLGLKPDSATRIVQPAGFGIAIKSCRKTRMQGYRAMFNFTLGEPMISALAKSVAIGYQKVSDFSPPGLSDPYRPDLIRPFVGFPGEPTRSLGLNPVLGNQYALLNNRCLRVPILQYQLMKGTRNLSRIYKRRTPRPNECVAFRALTPALYINIEWRSGDDLDLTVVEPNGNAINRFVTISPFTGGSLSNDNGSQQPCVARKLQEAVLYRARDNPLSGEYQIRARRSTITGADVCSEDIPWRLTVVKGGVIIKDVQGMITKVNPMIPDMNFIVSFI